MCLHRRKVPHKAVAVRAFPADAGEVQARVHQQRSGIDLSGFFLPVEPVGVKAPQVLDVEDVLRLAHDHQRGEGLCFVLADKFPFAEEGVVGGGGQAVKIPIPDEVVVFVVVRHLPPYQRPLLFGELYGVQLVAEGAAHGHVAPGFQAGAGVGRDMGAQGGDGVAQRRAELDGQAFDGVRIVAGPNLGGIVQHARVEPAAAGRTVLQKDMGESGGDTVHQVVDAQHVPVEEFPLPVWRQLKTGRLADVAVAVPFDVLDVVFGDDVVHLPENVVPHVLTGHVQHALVAGNGLIPAPGADGPVRMGAVQVAVGIDHLRFVPDAEFDAQGVDPLDQALQPALELLLVDSPVSQGAVVVAAVSKPAVVHHQHFDAQLLGLPGECRQLVVVKIEVGGLPAVDEQGPLLFGPFAAHQVVEVEFMEGAAHAAHAGVGIDQHGFRRGEAFLRRELPAEIGGVDAHQQPGAAPGIRFNINGEVPAVDQVEAVGLSRLLCAAVPGQGHKGVVVGARHAPLGLDGLDAVLQGMPCGGIFLCPAAVQVHHVEVHAGKIHAGAVGPFQHHGSAAPVFEPDAAGDDAVLLKDGIEQERPDAGDGVHGFQFQRLSLVLPGKSGGQAGQFGLSGENPVGDIPQVSDRVAVFPPHRAGGDAEIPGAVGGILQRVDVGGEQLVLHFGIVGAQGIEPAPVHQGGKVVVRQLCPVIEVHQIIFPVDQQGIGRGLGVQLKNSFL